MACAFISRFTYVRNNLRNKSGIYLVFLCKLINFLQQKDLKIQQLFFGRVFVFFCECFLFGFHSRNFSNIVTNFACGRVCRVEAS